MNASRDIPGLRLIGLTDLIISSARLPVRGAIPGYYTEEAAVCQTPPDYFVGESPTSWVADVAAPIFMSAWAIACRRFGVCRVTVIVSNLTVAPD